MNANFNFIFGIVRKKQVRKRGVKVLQSQRSDSDNRMTTEKNIQVEVKNSSSKLELNFPNETVLNNPSADFAVAYLDNSKPQDDTTVSLQGFFFFFTLVFCHEN